MSTNIFLGYIAEIGLDAVKCTIKDAAMEATARKMLIEYLKRQHKLNFNCTLEEEIDFGGLSDYIRTDLIEDVKLRFFGTKKERGIAYKTIIAKASSYAQTNTRISRQRAIKMVSTAINILKSYYERKANREMAFYAGRIEDTVIDEMSEQHAQLSHQMNELRNTVSSAALLSLDHNLRLAESGQIEEVGANLSKVIKAVSTTHPLYPYYGFSMKNLDGEMVSIPLSKEAVIKYPPRFSITANSIRIGSIKISELQSGDMFEYSYRHQLPITLDATTAIKLLGNTYDPDQAEAKKMQGSRIIILPPKFPEAFPCSISLNDKIIFDYLLMRTKEIMEDGTTLVTNEEQENRHFDIAFSINQNNKKMNFNIHPSTVSNIEQLKYHLFLKEAAKGGIIAIKVLSINSLLGFGNLAPFVPSESLNLEIEFLEKITEIEQYFGISLLIPDKIMVEDHRVIDHVYNIIHLGYFSEHWSTFNIEFEVSEELKKQIDKMEDTLYMFMYTCITNVELFNQKFSFPMKRELRAAKFKDLEKLQKKVKVLDTGDKIVINFIPDETDGNNTYTDTFFNEADMSNEQ